MDTHVTVLCTLLHATARYCTLLHATARNASGGSHIHVALSTIVYIAWRHPSHCTAVMIKRVNESLIARGYVTWFDL
eukprot:COSAG06_NODE_19961_length_816_cov_0.825662_1_plen_76_part_10